METLAKGANRVAFYDAVGLSGTWTRDIAAAITRLNYPSLERLCPAIVIHVDDEPGRSHHRTREGSCVRRRSARC